MKTFFQSMLLLAFFALDAACLSADSAREHAMRARPQSEEIEDSTMEFSYPFKLVGRAGVTVLRTPIIVGETLAGDRRLIGERGVMTKVDPEETRHDRDRSPAR